MLIPILIATVSLGYNFKLDTGESSVAIFNPEEIKNNIQVIHKSFVSSEYRFLESSSDANDFMQVSGELSLKAKSSADFGLQGVGDYLTNSVNRDDTIEMLIQVYHETQTETFPSYIPLMPDLDKKNLSSIGSHYIRSITYGGRLLISYTIKANKKEDLSKIKAAVNGHLQLSGGSLDVNMTGNLDKFTKEVSDISTASLRISATTELPDQLPTTLEEALKLADAYPKMVGNLNHGKGEPLQFEIVPLNTVTKKVPDYVENQALNGLFAEAVDKFDDMNSALNSFTHWLETANLTEEIEKEVSKFEQDLKTAHLEMREAIAHLDVRKGSDQFDKAFKLYGEGEENIPNRYNRWFSKIKDTVEGTESLWFPNSKAVSHYIHWGNTSCSLPSPQPLYYGYAATSTNLGSGGNFQCLPKHNPDLNTMKLNSDFPVSHISGLDYRLGENRTGPVLCSFCRLENATSVLTVPGRTECPAGTKLEYAGYLMMNRDSRIVSSFICLDESPANEFPKEEEDKKHFSGSATKEASLVPVWDVCPDCDDQRQLVACAVCSR